LENNQDYKIACEILLAAVQKAETELALARKRAEWTLRVISEQQNDRT